MVFVCLISIFCVSVSLTGGARWFIHRRSTLSGTPDFVCGYLSLFDSRKNVLKYFRWCLKTQILSPIFVLDQKSSSFVLAGVSQLELCFLWSPQLDGFTANPSHIYIYEEYFGIYNWFVFWVALYFQRLCVSCGETAGHTFTDTHLSALRAELFSLFHVLPSFPSSLRIFLISAISGEFDEAMKYGLDIPHGIGVS